MKTCTKCGEEKPATTEFFYKADGYLRNVCKECKSKYNKQYRKNNKEHIAELRKQYRQDNPEYFKQHYQENKESYAKNKRQWQKDNREKVIMRAAKRRAVKKGVTTENFTRQDVLDKWGTDCHICSDPIDLDNWDQDHVIPLQPKEGEPGEHTLANVKPSHPHCNRSKGNKTPCKPF